MAGGGGGGGNATVRLSFERLHYTVPIKGSSLPRALLTDIKGEVTSGHVLAILGPSGAGKTTLLNMLTLQQNGGSPSGHIRVNGEPLTASLYDRTCAYVEQFDTLWASLTVRGLGRGKLVYTHVELLYGLTTRSSKNIFLGLKIEKLWEVRANFLRQDRQDGCRWSKHFLFSFGVVFDVFFFFFFFPTRVSFRYGSRPPRVRDGAPPPEPRRSRSGGGG